MLKFDLITIFPRQIEIFISEGIFRIAKEKGKVEINVHDLRKWTTDNHKTVDDRPFGGGAGMILMIEPIFKAIKELKKENTKVIVTTPVGEKLTQKKVKEISKLTDHYIILCGHYEGFDNRIHEFLADLEISVGDYILSGGELAGLIVMDSVIRLIPGVLGNDTSLSSESFETGLEYPQYTRPEEFNGWKVPNILLSGNHKEIKKWQDSKSIELTKKRRPDIDK
ncbi:tRNA (guanosine(37)-N1)-methyltransferase TrmD [Candidatus Dojkabacteria bacterium]|jgi:tRNA (guanine37-N1)-methyltransferase|nr:tRNA (guanosine(37)-N1)-methyltransferase TrmD [Candidatus Dojkabacteria bacterium]